jgi:hypothetical protein
MDPLVGVRINLSHGVKNEEHCLTTLSTASPTSSNPKRCTSTALLVPPNRIVATLLSHEQHIMYCVLVSEVVQVLITKPDGYTNMLMNDESHTCVNGNCPPFCKEAGIFPGGEL